jgi:hypothetical protein
MDIDREALEGIFEFFQVAYKSMGYFANSQHIYFLSELTFCTTILVHHVLPYVVVPHGSPVRDGWDLIQREPTSHLCLLTFRNMWTFRIVIM